MPQILQEIFKKRQDLSSSVYEIVYKIYGEIFYSKIEITEDS